MKFDIKGRLRNMGLPDGKVAVLYSVYEAVSNSVHSISDRYKAADVAKKGRIDVVLKTNRSSEISSISVTDNGKGFDAANIESFDTCDSMHKYKRGGKGVGRLIWFNTFDTIQVDSVYREGNKRKYVKFDYDPVAESSFSNRRGGVSTKDPYATVRLSGLKTPLRQKIQKDSFLKELATHFLPLYVQEALPNIGLTYNGSVSELSDFFKKNIQSIDTQNVTVEVDGEAISLTFRHIFADPKISKELKNSYALTAHGRVVGDPINVAAKFALSDLDRGRSYIALVSGEFLDDRVNQERLGFRFTNTQKKDLENAVLSEIQNYLKDHIEKARKKQKKIVKSVLFEHPQLSSQIVDIDEYVSSIDPGMSDEAIVENLFVLLYRDEKKLQNQVRDLVNADVLTAEDKNEIERVLKELDIQEKNRLAELVVKRHQILQAANLLLKYEDAERGKYQYEKMVHELICPLGKMIGSGEFEDHNLWILDERLAFSELIASDKKIKVITGDKSASSLEPDIVFCNPLGFRDTDSNGTIAVVEFKRPGDSTPSSDPIDQTLKYVEEFRSRSIRGLQGDVISDVTEHTPFHVVVVCELTDATRKILKRGLAQTETPDGEGFFGYSKEHNAFIEVMSFKKMIRDATIRNQAFFQSLKLSNPSLEAKKRAAARLKKQESKGLRRGKKAISPKRQASSSGGALKPSLKRRKRVSGLKRAVPRRATT